MNELPESCIDCAEYGSEFCDDCMKELMENVPEKDRIIFSKALRQIAKKDIDKSEK